MRRLAAAALGLLLAGCAGAPASPESAESGPARGPRAGLGHGRGAARGSMARVAPSAATASGYDLLAALGRIRAGEAAAVRPAARAAAEKAQAAGDARTAADALAALAYASARLGEPQAALDAGRRALALLTPPPAGGETTLSLTHRFLGHTLLHLHRPEAARAEFQAALPFAMRARNGQPALGHVAAVEAGLAHAAVEMGDFAAGRAHAEKAIEMAERTLRNPRLRPEKAPTVRRGLADAWLQLAGVLFAAGDVEGAARAAESARGFASAAHAADTEARALATLAHIAARRGDADADKRYTEALARAERSKHVPLQIQLLSGMARSQAKAGRSQEALTTARRAIDLVETVRARIQDVELRSAFFEGKQELYNGAIHLALQANEPAEAFAFAERSRARAFLDLLGTHTALSKGRTQAFAEEEMRLRARLEAAKAGVAEDVEEDDAPADNAAAVEAATRAYAEFLERVRKTSGEQASLMSVEPVTLAEVQALLPADTALLEYLVTKTEVVAWVIRRDGADVVRLPVRQHQLVEQVRGFRAAIAERAPLADVERRAAALHAALVAPLRAHVPGERVIVVPHGPLHYLPFGALRTPEGRWLVEDWRLSTVPSASVLKYLPGKGDASAGPALALGNPDLGPDLMLRFAEREARAVGEAVPGARVFVRAEATERHAKTLGPLASLLHFATHAVLDEGDPLASALLLVPEGAEDGRLEVRELFRLDLRARLVVLSACETGLGRLSRGDDLVGLQRAFLYAGTPTVVTTLWKVDDRASFTLMRRFYDALGTSGPAEALRRAQRASLGEEPHPFFWAAFVVAGDPR